MSEVTELDRMSAALVGAIADKATAQANMRQARDLAAHIESENARLLAMLESIRVTVRQWELMTMSGKQPYILDAQFAADEIKWILEGNEA